MRDRLGLGILRNEATTVAGRTVSGRGRARHVAVHAADIDAKWRPVDTCRMTGVTGG